MAEIIRKEGLLIDGEERSWEEALNICGNLMMRLGSIKEGYIQAMINAVLELGPYIVIAPNIALAHAAAGKHVLKDDLVLTVFKKPVIFNSNNDPVYLMFGLCATEPRKHIDSLSRVAEAISNEKICQRLITSTSIEELYAIINGEGL